MKKLIFLLYQFIGITVIVGGQVAPPKSQSNQNNHIQHYADQIMIERNLGDLVNVNTIGAFIPILDKNTILLINTSNGDIYKMHKSTVISAPSRHYYWKKVSKDNPLLEMGK